MSDSNSPILRATLKEGICQLSLKDEKARPISPMGTLQSWLIDLRPVFLDVSLLRAAADLFWLEFADYGPIQIAAVETAAIPLMTAILLRAPLAQPDVSGFIIRKDRKSTGLGNLIEGTVSEAPIILIDDILNSGSSAEKARSVIAQIGRSIAAMFVVIDYRSKAGLAWRQKNAITICPVFALNEFGLELHSDPPPPSQAYRQLWHTGIRGGFAFHVVPKSGPVLVGGLIYRGSDVGKMHAFNARTGEIVWEHAATGTDPTKGIWSTPAIHEGRLYYGAYNGVLYCLDACSGQEIWSQSVCEWIGSSPLLVPEHNLLFVGLEYARPWARGALTAFDMRDGSKVWEQQQKRLQHGSAAYWRDGDLVIWGAADHFTLALEARTGKIAWGFKTGRSTKYAPAIDDQRGLVAFASFDKSIYVLDVATGNKRGEWRTNEICYTTPLFVGNKLYCGSGDRHLYVIDLDNMTLIKRVDLGARIYASPCLVDDRVIVGTSGGRVLEFDHDTLDITGMLQLPDAVTNAVVVSPDGTHLYVSTCMNDLFAIERLPRQK